MFWRTESKSTEKSCRFKTWMEFARQILMKLKTSSNEGLLIKVFSNSLMWLSKHCSGHCVTTQACTLIPWGYVHLRWCISLEDDTLWAPTAIKLVCGLLRDDVVKWEHFPHYRPFVQGIHQSQVDSPHKGQWCRALIFSLIYAWTNGCANNGAAGDLRCHHAHFEFTVMCGVAFSDLTTVLMLKHDNIKNALLGEQ